MKSRASIARIEKDFKACRNGGRFNFRPAKKLIKGRR